MFLASQGNRFSNPVGHEINTAAGELFDAIVDGGSGNRIRLALDGLIKIRAVQDFAPSEAVGFIFSLRRIMLDEIHQAISGGAQVDEILGVVSDFDTAALAAFAAYAEAKEKISQLRFAGLKSRSEGSLGEKR